MIAVYALGTLSGTVSTARQPADPGDTLAVISLVVSVASFFLAAAVYFSSGRQWRREGPLLAFDLTVVAYRHLGSEVVHRVQARMEVVNVGRMPALVRSAELRGPWSDSYVLTDITQGSGGPPMLQPTEYELSNSVEFLRPDGQVREALDRPPPRTCSPRRS